MMRFQVKVIILTIRNNYSLEKQIIEGPRSLGEAVSALRGHQRDRWAKCPFPGSIPNSRMCSQGDFLYI